MSPILKTNKQVLQFQWSHESTCSFKLHQTNMGGKNRFLIRKIRGSSPPRRSSDTFHKRRSHVSISITEILEIKYNRYRISTRQAEIKPADKSTRQHRAEPPRAPVTSHSPNCITSILDFIPYLLPCSACNELLKMRLFSPTYKHYQFSCLSKTQS